MKFEDRKPETLEEIVAMYGKALAVIDDETGELKVMTAGSGAHSVDLEGKPKKGTPKPKGDGFLPDDEDDDDDEEGGNYTEKELKLNEYLEQLDDGDFDNLYPEESDEERAEELKVLFDVGFAFARRALTGGRKKKRKKKYKDISDDTEIKAQGTCWDGYVQVGMKKGKRGRMVPNCVPVGSKSAIDGCCPEDSEVETKAAKKKLRDPEGGLTAAGRAHFKKKEGANLKPGVKGAADTPDKMRRKGSFLTRFFTNPSGPMKDEKGRPTRLALSASAWGEAVPQNAEDAAALASKGRKMLERYENSKKKDAWSDMDTKTLGPTIGATGNTSDEEMVDRDGDGVVFDGTPDEKPTPNRKKYEKMPNSYLEKRRRKKVQRDLTTEGVKPTQGPGRTEKEKNARARARDTFSQDEDRKRFVRNQLKKQGIAANAKKEDRDDNERAARKAGRAEYDRRVRDGEPKKAKPTPPKRELPEGYVPGKPPDRYPEPKKDTSIQDAEDARNRRKAGAIARNETERFERLRPKDTSNQRAEDARNRAKRPAMRPADRYEKPRPSKPKRPSGYSQGDVV